MRVRVIAATCLAVSVCLLPGCYPSATDASEEPVRTRTPRLTAEEIDARFVQRAMEQHLDELSNGHIERARQTVVAPSDIWMEQRLANGLRQLSSQIEEGLLMIRVGEVRTKGRWGVVELDIIRSGGEEALETQEPMFLFKCDDGAWRLAPDSIWDDTAVQPTLDADHESLQAWYDARHPQSEKDQPGREMVAEEAEALIAAAGLAERSLLGGRITMLVPAAFGRMTESMLRLKYPNQRPPQVVFTNAAGSVNIALSHTTTPVNVEHLDGVRRAVELQMRQAYPSAEWIDSGPAELNGAPCFRLDLRTPAADGPVRNIIVGTVCQRRLLLITFNCTVALEQEWISVGEAAIASIEVASP